MAAPADSDALREALRGLDGSVRFDPQHRALYAADASNYRHVPTGVVFPRHAGDAERALAVCREHGAAVLSRGAGTSIAGQAVNTAVVLDFSRHMDRVLEIDPERRRARVEPGVVLDDLRRAAAPHGLTFAPDPSTADRCTLGGMLGNDACGVHSLMAGRTIHNVESLDVVTGDGLRLAVGATDDARLAEVRRRGGRAAALYRDLLRLRARFQDAVRARLPDIPRRVSGFPLDQLLPEKGFHLARALVGSEGTCATVLEAELRLVPDPPGRALVVLGYPDVAEAAADVPSLLEHAPIGLEGLDDVLVDGVRAKGKAPGALADLPEGRGWLLVELGGAGDREAAGRAEALCADAVRRGRGRVRGTVLSRRADQRRLWAVRKSALAATAFVPGEPTTWPGWEDSAVAPERLGDYLRELRALLRRFDYRASLYGHFGDGCVHARIGFDLESDAGVARFRRFLEEAADLVVDHGGSLSGEHGDGQARGELLERMVGRELVDAFRAFKAAWDPEGRLNPGRVVDPRPLDADLRLRTDPRRGPDPRDAVFAYPEDGGRFDRAVGRCVGVGLCRRSHGGTMCPSYKVVREERHTTRGRARLLQEMLRGETLRDGWRSREVKEALDLCLSCKGCLGDCPVDVDIGTWKAEFLSHYYRGRLRPRAAWALGGIPAWARLASLAPGLANALAESRPGAAALRALGGLAPERPLPRFADRPWTRSPGRPPRAGDGAAPGPGQRPTVLLWPDTFSNHFEPGVLASAQRVLERAGFAVERPAGAVCCGRPLYDFGALGPAQRLLDRTLRVLEEPLERLDGPPVVVLEPSCLAVFRHELPSLRPDDPRAALLRERSRSLPELLREHGAAPPALSGRALLHGHCHQEALWGQSDDAALLRQAGADLATPDTGCCGLAGAFGFERDKYAVSMAVGETALFPAVRAEPEATRLVADGFSCRAQIAHGTGRRALHLAEVLDVAAATRPVGA